MLFRALLSPSLDHLVGAGDDRGRKGEAQCAGGFQIDDQIMADGLLYGDLPGGVPFRILSTKTAARR